MLSWFGSWWFASLSLGDWRLSPELSGWTSSGSRLLRCTIMGPCDRVGDAELPCTAHCTTSWVNSPQLMKVKPSEQGQNIMYALRTGTTHASKLLPTSLKPKAGQWNGGKIMSALKMNAFCLFKFIWSPSSVLFQPSWMLLSVIVMSVRICLKSFHQHNFPLSSKGSELFPQIILRSEVVVL